MKKGIKPLLRNWLIHFAAAWVAINVFNIIPYIYHTWTWGYYTHNVDGSPVTIWQHFLNTNYYQHDYLVVALFLLITEFNYRYLFKKLNLWMFSIFSLAAGILSFPLMAYLHPDSLKLLGKLSATEPVLIMGAYAFVYALVRDYFYQLRHKKDLQLQQYKNELQSLKGQLNPHFLFNSLNYLYGTALREKATDTAAGIDAMAEMMRYTITGTHESFVPLKAELEFIERYLLLQQGRIPQKESIKINVQMPPTEQGDLTIAPLLLLPFVENAFKYGISIDQPCFIDIKIEVKDERLTMHIINSVINGYTEVKGNNTGIKNTVKRLELLYRDKHSLEINKNETDYKVVLAISLNKTNL